MKVFKPSEVKQLRQSRLSLVLKKTSEARKDKCFVAGLGVFKNVQNSLKKVEMTTRESSCLLE